MLFLSVLIGLALLSLLVVALRIGRRESIAPKAQKRILRLWEIASQFDDPNKKILETEKVVDVLFKEMDLRGSFAEKLKAVEAYIPNKEYVWTAHKLRNRIAHEPGFTASERDAKHAAKAFGKIIHKYCR